MPYSPVLTIADMDAAGAPGAGKGHPNRGIPMLPGLSAPGVPATAGATRKVEETGAFAGLRDIRARDLDGQASGKAGPVNNRNTPAAAEKRAETKDQRDAERTKTARPTPAPRFTPFIKNPERPRMRPGIVGARPNRLPPKRDPA